MTQEEAEAKVRRRREQYPVSFSKPGGEPNEIWLGDWPLNIVEAHLQELHREGYSTARIGPMVGEDKQAIFVDAVEGVIVDEVQENIHVQKKS